MLLFFQKQKSLESLDVTSLAQVKELQEIAKTASTTLHEITLKFKKDLDALTADGKGEVNETQTAELLRAALKAM